MKKQFLKGFWRLFKGYWGAEDKWKARGLLGVVLALNFAAVYLLVLINQWYNTFYNALQDYRYQDFWPLIGEFLTLAFIHIAVAVYAIYLRQMLQINWRRWMTKRYLEEWLAGQTYYRMQLLEDKTDNPDQRISEDIAQFVTLTLELSLGLLKQIAMLGAFIVILWNLSGVITVPIGSYEFTVYGYMVWLSIVYAVIGTYLTAKIGNPLINLNYNQQRYEADFRFRMVRLRENSESIAFYQGEKPEKTGFLTCFADVVKNYFSLMKYGKRLTWFITGYRQLAIIFPILLAAPRYFGGQMQLGGLMQTTSAFGNVQDSLSFFVERYGDVAQWIAVVKRLTGFIDHIDNGVDNEVRFKEGGRGAIVVNGLNVRLPDGTALLSELALTVASGDRILITGASGCGKSTLMRTIAGIWPFGEGEITVPRGDRRLFLPQRPYLPLGTLREVLLYPEEKGNVSDADIKAVLSMCLLEKLMASLDAAEDWQKILSLGEQQRVAFARLLLVKPDWAFLDEATSALDEQTERSMYRLLAKYLPAMAVISIGHRGTLHAYHQMNLQLDGLGGWNVK